MQSAKSFEHNAAELWCRHSVGWQESRCQELLAPQKIGRSMIRRKSTRHPHQLFSRQTSKKPPKWAGIQNGYEPSVVDGNMMANSRQILGFRAIQPSSDQKFVRRNVKIEACSLVLSQASVGKSGGHMRFVRRFIFRKSRVPIDTIEADFGGCHDFGCERGEFGCQGVDKFDHRLVDVYLVGLLVLQEPFAVIVPLKLPEEGQACSGKLRQFG